MAKVVITIEDKPDGRVSVVSTPKLSEIFNIEISGNDLTSAHGYAFSALRAIRESGKEQNPSKIIIPKVRRM